MSPWESRQKLCNPNVGHPSIQCQPVDSGMHAVGDLDITDVQRVFSFNPPCREDSGGAIYLEFVFGVKYLDPRLVSWESYWVANIQVGKWPLWSGMGSLRMGLCGYFFDQVIHCSHGARWVYTLYHLPLNGNLDGGQMRKFLSHCSCCTTPLTPIPALTTELLLVSNPYPTTPAGLSA